MNTSPRAVTPNEIPIPALPPSPAAEGVPSGGRRSTATVDRMRCRAGVRAGVDGGDCSTAAPLPRPLPGEDGGIAGWVPMPRGLLKDRRSSTVRRLMAPAEALRPLRSPCSCLPPEPRRDNGDESQEIYSDCCEYRRIYIRVSCILHVAVSSCRFLRTAQL